jgi:hypothetical protein
MNLPNSKEDAPENPFANLILDVVERKLIRSGRTDIIAVSRTFVWMLRPLEAQLIDETERLGHVQTEDVPLKSIRGGQREEVAGSCIVESLWLLRRPLDATGLEGDVTALVNHDGGTREDVHTLLVFEMRASGSGEGRDESANHTRKKRQKLGISSIVSIDEGSLESRLMGEGAKRMNVCEKVVDKGFQDGPGRNGLAIEMKAGFVDSRNRDECLGGGMRGGTAVTELLQSSHADTYANASKAHFLSGDFREPFLETNRLDSLVGGTTTFDDAIIRAFEVKIDTRLARSNRIAFDFSLRAIIARA